jgi:transposase
MAKTLSEDLRVRMIAAVEVGLSRHAAAERFGIGVATAVRWLRAWHEAGATAAKPRGGDRHTARIEAFGAMILAELDRQVDITLVELAELLEREHGQRFAPSTIWRFLDRRGLTFKKTAHASEQARPDVAARREAWFAQQPELDPKRLVFIDGEARAPLVRAMRRTAHRPRWRACGAVRRVASAAARRCRTGAARAPHGRRTGTGRPRPSPARSGCRA